MFKEVCENYYTHNNGCYYCPNFYSCLINSQHNSSMKAKRMEQNDEAREKDTGFDSSES